MVKGSKCENKKCYRDNDRMYGSGRFCSSPCARSFSTSKQRTLINQKVSESLKGRIYLNTALYRQRVDKMVSTRKTNRKNRIMTLPFEKLGRNEKRIRIFFEQEEACLFCQLDKWNGLPIVLELDHIDGNKLNNLRENLRLLCPNCHSQTPTWRRKKQAVVVQQIE